MTPRIDGEVHWFAEQGLYDGLFLMKDEESETYWDHMTGEAVYGPHVGKSLAVDAGLVQTTVGQVLKTSPDALVTLSDEAIRTDDQMKTQGLIAGMLGRLNGMFESTVEEHDTRRDQMDLGLGLWTDELARYYPLNTIRSEDRFVIDRFGGRNVVVMIDPTNFVLTAFSTDASAARWDENVLRLDDGSTIADGVMRDADGALISGGRPLQVFTRWYGFSLILVSTEPAELIVTDGPPRFAPEAGGELLIVTNTESDMLVEVETQRTFVLLSGRWFAAAGATEPWTFVASNELPESFADIDPDGDWGYLLTWVAGTEMAQEAVLDSYVPQTAAIKRDATIEVSFDGEPKFEPIEETSLYYAVNTQSQVIQAGDRYFAVEEAVWYVADDPSGPWRVATEVPEEVQAIPASSPVYNVKYVEVFDSTPEVVYVGYYPGYLHSYHYHGSLVYGTGWWYRPWWGPYRFYPRHRTWGFHVRWNPWWGWSAGFSWSSGRWTFGIGTGGWGWSWGWSRGWWGPAGWHGYRRGYHRGWHNGWRAGARAGYQAGVRSARQTAARNLYARDVNRDRVAATRDRVPGAATAAAARAPAVASGQANNVRFAVPAGAP